MTIQDQLNEAAERIVKNILNIAKHPNGYRINEIVQDAFLTDPYIQQLVKDGEPCLWTYDEHHFAWNTKCGNKFQFSFDGPKENGMKYCPYCGGVLSTAFDAAREQGRL